MMWFFAEHADELVGLANMEKIRKAPQYIFPNLEAVTGPCSRAENFGKQCLNGLWPSCAIVSSHYLDAGSLRGL